MVSAGVKKQAYGTWDSVITTDDMTARSVSLSQVRVDGLSTFWVEGRSQDGGRNVLMHHTNFAGSVEVLPLIEGTTLTDVRTRVHEYGGRAYAVSNGIIVFSQGSDNRVYLYDLNNPLQGIRPLTELNQCRYGDFELDLVNRVVYAVCEDHSKGGEPNNYLVSIPLDGTGARNPQLVRVLFSGTDFVMAPTVSPDADKLAFVVWNHPHMPWQQSTLLVADISEGALLDPHVLVDEPNVSVSEPRWTLQGDLIHIDDSTGWLNLYRTEGFNPETAKHNADSVDWRPRLRTRRLHPGNRNFSHPAWALGLHSFDIFDDDYLLCSWTQDGFWHLGTVRIDNGQLEEWNLGWWPTGNVSVSGGRVVILADSATSTATVIEIIGHEVKELRNSTYLELDPAHVSVAKAISWPTRDGETCHGFFYAPVNPDFIGTDAELPPLIVMAHGGPTSATRPGLNLAKQFWTSRGFAVLDVNYRGSSGWSKDYCAKLQGQWGVVDVNDCADGVKFLVTHGIVDGNRVAIRGGSAGGYTTLAALVSSDVFTAGTSLYGIGDIKLLAAETHKFESRYMEGLVGTADLEDPVYAERSPINHIEKVTAPLLLLQGEDDKVVPPSQAITMRDALEAAGRVVELKMYAGEGHGFVKAENIKDALERELNFYLRTWGLV
ncbi:peptidase, S9A/B/C family, catalytic domain protein [Gleimia coleocanis DSM 15436]|uniref:Peptidase, S9A/B/C family, catalytic domain protein n=1 Tax=Gleimia coleocanis DSM 15436 TaxID=525245 RepID=C0W1R9_9ACTO|nr:S9 family peptidase [Gleimia coleocanis]EEH63435.1 peptidase, S9A/B/C family, catalytic domain protein [Gleimia coleocanis DSM 15436]